MKKITTMQAVTQQNKPLLLPTSKGIEVININEVIRIEAISNYSKLIFTNGKTLVVAKVLRWFEDVLSTARFIRVHRTHLVNKQFIHHYMKGEGGKIKLMNGDWIEVSRRKRSLVVQGLYSMAA
jgi:two-component system, LytTR family, response regulator